jgi:hypothetical protein
VNHELGCLICGFDIAKFVVDLQRSDPDSILPSDDGTLYKRGSRLQTSGFVFPSGTLKNGDTVFEITSSGTVLTTDYANKVIGEFHSVIDILRSDGDPIFAGHLAAVAQVPPANATALDTLINDNPNYSKQSYALVHNHITLYGSCEGTTHDNTLGRRDLVLTGANKIMKVDDCSAVSHFVIGGSCDLEKFEGKTAKWSFGGNVITTGAPSGSLQAEIERLTFNDTLRVYKQTADPNGVVSTVSTVSPP